MREAEPRARGRVSGSQARRPRMAPCRQDEIEMKSSDPEVLEVTRLVLKFFPEARAYFQSNDAILWELFCGAMQTATFAMDDSCDPYSRSADPIRRFADTRGFDGDDEDIYLRLLAHTGINPKGRAVVMPDAIGASSWSHDIPRPFVCHSRTVPERLREIRVFGSGNNTLFVFESGEAILVDHDDRIYWARSRMRRRV